ncbi:hypothetical protein KKJ09_18365 [Xenorhabdus bovienii]|uniref:hypothetical protein n=1 Tax=Xenorhabdus bovienii TaxID=40576 RepID=UPI0023B338F6|nr:hypothetical protein [Xenorhabdus bovienii]MDE9495494.1 hypothetical protein [Xenorhabdus bovienii]MDE9503918.1 hypothetical protein [Xenorhabdus bovienii]
MLKHDDMTTAAACVLETIPANNWVTADDVSNMTGLSFARCQLILTQFSLAGLAIDQDGELFRRCQ